MDSGATFTQKRGNRRLFNTFRRFSLVAQKLGVSEIIAWPMLISEAGSGVEHKYAEARCALVRDNAFTAGAGRLLMNYASSSRTALDSVSRQA